MSHQPPKVFENDSVINPILDLSSTNGSTIFNIFLWEYFTRVRGSFFSNEIVEKVIIPAEEE